MIPCGRLLIVGVSSLVYMFLECYVNDLEVFISDSVIGSLVG